MVMDRHYCGFQKFRTHSNDIQYVLEIMPYSNIYHTVVIIFELQRYELQFCIAKSRYSNCAKASSFDRSIINSHENKDIQL